MAKRYSTKDSPSSKGVSAEAAAIWEIAREVLSTAKRQKVVLIHMPRGATPIVEGINYVASKLAPGKRPYEVVKVPFSRENISRPEIARKTITDSLAGVPKNTTVFYVDETRSGTVTSANAQDIERTLRSRGCQVKTHLIAAGKGVHLRNNSVNIFQKIKGTVVLHKVPGRISWADNTRALGFNWGLMHRFPEEALERIIGGGKKRKTDILELKRTFLQRYNKKITLGKEKKFRTVQYSSHFYARRQEQAVEAFREAVKATGFGEKYHVNISGNRVRVNGKSLPFWNLQKFLHDNHPRTEMAEGSRSKRFAYKRVVNPDPNILVDIRGISPESKKNSRRIQGELGTLFNRSKRRPRR
tara:strand:- start:1820 stop:2890 length:1071 start_codon:yes stop_codon:yes gene_type:complete